MNALVKTLLITAVGVIIGLVAYEAGKKMLGIDGYEDEFEELN